MYSSWPWLFGREGIFGECRLQVIPVTASPQGQPPSLPRLSPVLAVQDEAYQTLAQGDTDKAAALFQHLVAQTEPQLQSQGYTGLAAVAWARGDTPQTLEHAAQAETLDPDVAYVHVLRGHLLWQQEQDAGRSHCLSYCNR